MAEKTKSVKELEGKTIAKVEAIGNYIFLIGPNGITFAKIEAIGFFDGNGNYFKECE